MEDLLYKRLNRREFIKYGLSCAVGLSAIPIAQKVLLENYACAATGNDSGRHEASYYLKIDRETVKCTLCPHGCLLKNGTRGLCRVREPAGGKLYTLVYELPCAVHVDPIEKKPLYHMLPGTRSFSIATAGCNLRCKYCQNWQISQSRPEDTVNQRISCEEVVAYADKEDCRSIAYTYSEPTVFYEYMADTARLAKDRGIKNIYVTAAYINPEPLRNLCPYIDAANIDLKAFDDKLLNDMCGESLDPLLDAIKIMKSEGVWIEITNLIVPTMNDNMSMIGHMCSWIRENMGAETPLHFSRFHPTHKLRNLPPTPIETLERAWDVAKEEGLRYVYLGNIAGHPSRHTYCPNCGEILIYRAGYRVEKINLKESCCVFCGRKIAGVWE
jgi:pyruvate formate lyase activating enzyme